MERIHRRSLTDDGATVLAIDRLPRKLRSLRRGAHRCHRTVIRVWRLLLRRRRDLNGKTPMCSLSHLAQATRIAIRPIAFNRTEGMEFKLAPSTSDFANLMLKELTIPKQGFAKLSRNNALCTSRDFQKACFATATVAPVAE